VIFKQDYAKGIDRSIRSAKKPTPFPQQMLHRAELRKHQQQRGIQSRSVDPKLECATPIKDASGF